MDQTRRALLIGVGTTPEAAGRFDSLEKAVAADLRALASSLRASEYEVEVLEEATRRDITSRISAAAQEVPADGTLLIHFTGHGVRVGDADYLVPHDALVPADEDGSGGDWQQPHVVESLVPADISRYLGGCRAGTVLWTVDACRSPMSADAGAWFGSRILTGPPTGRFALLTGCAAGQVSGHTADGSFFTRGLAEALRPLTAARTVEEVFATAAASTAKFAHAHGLLQQPKIRYGSDLEPQTRSAVVCSGRQLLESWREAVRTCPLWDRVPPGEEADVARFREVLGDLVDTSARTVDQAQRRLPDPWADDGFPVRLLGEVLPLLLPERTSLSGIEVAALVAAPFLHEAAWANRLSSASEVDPLSVSVQPDGDARRRHYEQVAEHHPHIARKIQDSLLREDVEEARNVAVWLVHRWITEQFETDEHAVPPGYVEPFAKALTGDENAGSARVCELSDAVQEITSAISLSTPLDETPSPTVRIRLGKGSKPVRTRPLAVLMHLAAALALDVRALPDVIAEHLAVPDGVLPQDVVSVLHEAGWDAEGEALHLDAVCGHPAIHAALAGAVEYADELGCALVEAARHLSASDAELLAAVPARVTDRRLRPLESRGRRAYDVPLLRFQLSQTEVRELLMGEQLYDGRPELALRELYQNAMDACRYREMRWRYLKGKGRQPMGWEGRISFVQGRDDRGPYVECRDTGVGMGVEQLKNTFTRAGRRFEQSRTFRREQEAWLRHDRSLRLYPNSRFGIGVFSYFMLADEMTIVTRQVGTDGAVAPKALLVHISSSGSLFRIQEYDEPGDGMAEGGTRVRLHLRDSAVEGGLSCVDVLRSLVLVSEFDLEARDDVSGASHPWRPRELQPLPGTTSSVEAVADTLWWVDGLGAVLCDGIRTDREPFGYVLNLTGPHAGELSVNRATLQNYDRQREARLWQEGAPALASWEALTMSWLWTMEDRGLGCAQVLWSVLEGQGMTVPITYGDRTVELDQVGWFAADRGFTPDQSPETSSSAPWRIAAHGGQLPSARRFPPASLAGHPVPAPGWSRVAQTSMGDWRVLIRLAYLQQRKMSEVLGIVHALRITDPQVSPPVCSPDDLDWVPNARDRGIIDGLMGGEDSPGTGMHSHQHARDDLGGLVRASFADRIPLDELVERCGQYGDLMEAMLPQVPEHHRGYVCDAADLAVLYLPMNRFGGRPTRGMKDILHLARAANRDPGHVAEHVSRFAWLGWPAHDARAVEQWCLVPEDERALLAEFAHAEEEGQALPWSATLAYAGRFELALSEAEEKLGAWAARLGLAYQERYPSGSTEGELVPAEATAALMEAAHAKGLRLENGLSLRDLAFARGNRGSDGDPAVVMTDLRAAGVQIGAGLGLVTAWPEMSNHHRTYFAGREASLWEMGLYPLLPSTDAMFAATCELREPLGRVRQTVQDLAAPLGLPVPELPGELLDAVPGLPELSALISSDAQFYDEWTEPPEWIALTSHALARHALERSISPKSSYERLSPFRAMGALVPELTEAEAAALPETTPGPGDVAALDPDHRVTEPGTPLVPFDVVSIAGRLGESVSTTWQRIAPYLALEAGPVTVTSVPDVLPLWQDLILLSADRDGQLPALQGEVTARQTALAARAVGEDEEWVRDRLRLYADMFGLEWKEPRHDA